MCLPNSLPISASQVNVELGRNAGDPFDMLGSAELALAGQAGAPNSMSNFAGKCNRDLILQYSNFAGGVSWASVPYGSIQTNRRIFVGIIHGPTASDPGLAPTCTVSGSSATRLSAHTTGSGTGPATGAAWFSANPGTTSGTITAAWSTLINLGIVVLSGYNYTTGAGEEGDGGATGDGNVGFGFSAMTNGAIMALSTYSSLAGGATYPSWGQLNNILTWNLGFATSNSGGLGILQPTTNNCPSCVYTVNPAYNVQGKYQSSWIAVGP